MTYDEFLNQPTTFLDDMEKLFIIKHNYRLEFTKQEQEINPEIQLSDKISIKMRYPEFGVIKDSVNMSDITEVTFNLISDSIEYIYDGEQFYYASETTPDEMLSFVEGMNQQQFAKVEEFFNNLPELKETIHLKCSKCGFEHNIDVQGLENFFG